jgi:hypothetical protein
MNRKRTALVIAILVLIAAIMLFWSGGSLSRYSAELASSAPMLELKAADHSYPQGALL